MEMVTSLSSGHITHKYRDRNPCDASLGPCGDRCHQRGVFPTQKESHHSPVVTSQTYRSGRSNITLQWSHHATLVQTICTRHIAPARTRRGRGEVLDTDEHQTSGSHGPPSNMCNTQSTRLPARANLVYITYMYACVH